MHAATSARVALYVPENYRCGNPRGSREGSFALIAEVQSALRETATRADSSHQESYQS